MLQQTLEISYYPFLLVKHKLLKEKTKTSAPQVELEVTAADDKTRTEILRHSICCLFGLLYLF
jgi:hypothetical protein